MKRTKLVVIITICMLLCTSIASAGIEYVPCENGEHTFALEEEYDHAQQVVSFMVSSCPEASYSHYHYRFLYYCLRRYCCIICGYEYVQEVSYTSPYDRCSLNDYKGFGVIIK